MKPKSKSKSKSKIKNSQGFTLVELLVVISIIGLMASVILVSTANFRKIARDTVRVAQLRQLRTALDLYFDDFGAYPSTGGVFQGSCWPPAEYIPGLVPNYIARLPIPPLNCQPAPFTPESLDLYYISDGKNYEVGVHPETRDLRFKAFFTPYNDGGPDDCKQDGDLPNHFMITTFPCP